MKEMAMVLLVCMLVMNVGCSQKYEDAEVMMKQPINCATAEGDIRMLMHEKAHVEDQILQGVSAFSPAGLVVGVATGTDEREIFEIGHLIADMHTMLDAMPMIPKRWKLDERQFLDRPI